jgi:hypothetical protein
MAVGPGAPRAPRSRPSLLGGSCVAGEGQRGGTGVCERQLHSALPAARAAPAAAAQAASAARAARGGAAAAAAAARAPGLPSRCAEAPRPLRRLLGASPFPSRTCWRRAARAGRGGSVAGRKAGRGTGRGGGGAYEKSAGNDPVRGAPREERGAAGAPARRRAAAAPARRARAPPAHGRDALPGSRSPTDCPSARLPLHPPSAARRTARRPLSSTVLALRRHGARWSTGGAWGPPRAGCVAGVCVRSAVTCGRARVSARRAEGWGGVRERRQGVGSVAGEWRCEGTGRGVPHGGNAVGRQKRQCGGAVRQCGSVAVRRCGGAAVRRCGGVAVWCCGSAPVPCQSAAGTQVLDPGCSWRAPLAAARGALAGRTSTICKGGEGQNEGVGRGGCQGMREWAIAAGVAFVGAGGWRSREAPRGNGQGFRRGLRP